MIAAFKRYLRWRRLDRRLRNRSRYARVVLTPASNDGLTWTCHVCADERPDAFIDVHQRRHMWPGGVVVTENIRYCNDRPECRMQAGQVYFSLLDQPDRADLETEVRS